MPLPELLLLCYTLGMKRLILFSHVTEIAQQRVFPLLFPDEIPHKVFACMPGDGSLRDRQYLLFCDSWKAIANRYGAEFLYIDNSKDDASEELAKLRRANILLITGGNACVLLRNVRKSGLDQAIKDFAQKDHYVVAGYSAGAMLLTPTVQLAAFELWRQENKEVGLTTFDALHLVDFEVFPHYDETAKEMFDRYTRITPYTVKPIADDECICIDVKENSKES